MKPCGSIVCREHPMPATSVPSSSSRWSNLGFLVAATVVALVVYGPALNRVFVADQIWYFLQLEGSTSLGDGLRLYDYSLSRKYAKGDELLFRPLLMAWLAVQNSLFGRDPWGWNASHL